jgi:hypothetical protein
VRHRPIFILGLQRGGTNQLLNVLRSHPDTIWPDGELHEVLRPYRRIGRQPLASIRTIVGYLPMLLRTADALSPHRGPPPMLSERQRGWIRSVLARETPRNSREVARYKQELVSRGLCTTQPRMDRMLVKVVNYNVGLAEDLSQIYPDAQFIGLIRDPFGVCEGMISRGAQPDRVIMLYAYVANTLVLLEKNGIRLKVVRFEDLLFDVRASSEGIYRFCGLDPGVVDGLCLQDKQRVFDAEGRVVGSEKVPHFADFASVGRYMRSDVNATAKARLSPEMRRRISDECRSIMARFGYAGDAEAA